MKWSAFVRSPLDNATKSLKATVFSNIATLQNPHTQTNPDVSDSNSQPQGSQEQSVVEEGDGTTHQNLQSC